MRKLFNILITLLLIMTTQAKTYSAAIDKTIAQSDINKGAVSVSVKDAETGKVIYKLNDKQPTMPASTLKLITLGASLDTLGDDYEFSTKLYKTTNNDLYLKLGADPFLTSAGLNSLMEKAVKDKKITSPKIIYIDDYIFDKTEWGEGWQWDDDLNPLMPKFSSYNIDKNLLSIIISPTNPGSPAQIYTNKFYPITFINLVTTGTENDIELNRNNSIAPNILNISGTINKQITEEIPINNPKRYFILRLEDAIKSAKMDYYGGFPQKKTPTSNIYLVAEIKHPISQAIKAILMNSNNFVAETVFKLAGAKFVNNTGSLSHSQEMLNAYFKKIGVNALDIKIVDGSGVSKNNIITTDFMTDYLVKQSKNEAFKNALPTSGEGTLRNITSRSGKTYAFDIMINDPKTKSNDKKSLEEYIIRDIYTSY